MSDAADLDASSDTNISISQSTKEESCSREDPEASTDSKTGTSQPTTEGQSCEDINPDVSSDTSSISQSTARHESCNNGDAEASTDELAPLRRPTTENESSNDADPEAPADTSEPETLSPFDDPTVRRAFVQKVFCIEILTLLFAIGVVCLFSFSGVIAEGVRRNIWVYFSSIIISIAVSIILCCFKSDSRRHPWNLVRLALVTLTFSFMLGTVASYIGAIPVLFALEDTILIFLAIIVFNAQSRVDFSMCFGFILSVAVPLIKFGIMYGIYPDFSFMLFVDLGSVWAFGLSMVFVVYTHRMIRNEVLRPKEYATAALLLYLDITMTLVCIMGLLLTPLCIIVYLFS